MNVSEELECYLTSRAIKLDNQLIYLNREYAEINPRKTFKRIDKMKKIKHVMGQRSELSTTYKYMFGYKLEDNDDYIADSKKLKEEHK